MRTTDHAVRLTGDAIGAEDLAVATIAAYEERAATVGTAINDAHDDPTISVVRFTDPVRLYQRASFSGVVLDDAGLARPDTQQSTDDATFIREISPEELALGDGDHVFFTIPGATPEETDALRATVTGNPLWASVPAVAHGRATEMPDETWMAAVGLFGAHIILDDLATTFAVDPAR